MPSAPHHRLLGPLLALALAACSNSASEGADGGSPLDVPFIPLSCGATDDCISAGLDADTCVYPSAIGGCAATGHCQVLDLSSNPNSCTAQQEICPCSGGTQLVPPCWPKGLSPYPILSVGACPVDAGTK